MRSRKWKIWVRRPPTRNSEDGPRDSDARLTLSSLRAKFPKTLRRQCSDTLCPPRVSAPTRLTSRGASASIPCRVARTFHMPALRRGANTDRVAIPRRIPSMLHAPALQHACKVRRLIPRMLQVPVLGCAANTARVIGSVQDSEDTPRASAPVTPTDIGLSTLRRIPRLRVPTVGHAASTNRVVDSAQKGAGRSTWQRGFSEVRRPPLALYPVLYNICILRCHSACGSVFISHGK